MVYRNYNGNLIHSFGAKCSSKSGIFGTPIKIGLLTKIDIIFILHTNRYTGQNWTSESGNFGKPVNIGSPKNLQDFHFFCIIGRPDQNDLPNQGFSENRSKMIFWIREFRKIGQKCSSKSGNFEIPNENELPNQGISENCSKSEIQKFCQILYRNW